LTLKKTEKLDEILVFGPFFYCEKINGNGPLDG